MARRFAAFEQDHLRLIAGQQMVFVATAAPTAG